MPSRDRRAAGRRRAWGRGPIILKFEPLEGRQLLTGPGLLDGAGDAGAETSVPPTEATILADPDASATSADDVVTTTSLDDVTTAVGDLAATSSPIDRSTTVAELTSATTQATGSGLPDLIAAKFSAQSNLDWDQDFFAQIAVRNQGKAAATKPFTIDVYASPGLTLTQGAVKIGTVDVPAGLRPGETFQFEKQFTTPKVPIVDARSAPSYYLLLVVDAKNDVAESDESNNFNRGLQAIDASMVTITPRLPSKLAAGGLVVTPDRVQWGGSLHVKATVRNDGEGKAPPTNARVVLAPAGENPFGPRGYTVGSVPIPAVLGYQSVTAEQVITLPTDPPSALANVSEFSVTLLVDGDLVADPVVRPFQWRGPGVDWATLHIDPKPSTIPAAQRPDLKVVSLENPRAVAWGETITVKAKIENDGPRDAGPFKVRFLLLQGDGPDAPVMSLGDADIPSVAADHTQDVVQTLKLPARVPDGLNPGAPLGRIAAVIDPHHTVDESRLDNNSLASTPIELRVVGSDGNATPVVTLPPTPARPGSPQPTGGDPAPNPGPGSTAGRLRDLLAQRRAQALARLTLLRRNPNNRPGLRVFPAGQGPIGPGVRPLPRLLAGPPGPATHRPGAGKPA